MRDMERGPGLKYKDNNIAYKLGSLFIPIEISREREKFEKYVIQITVGICPIVWKGIGHLFLIIALFITRQPICRQSMSEAQI